MTPVPQRVWDGPLRAFHWALVLLFAFSWWTAETGRMQWHIWSGLSLLALLLFRIYWGFFGSSTARFAHFLRGPRAVLGYVRELRRGGPATHHPGHNPLGALSVLALLGLLGFQVTTGLFAVDTSGMNSGPLASWVSYRGGRDASNLHGTGFDLLLIVIGLHILAILAYRVFKRQNLVAPMLHGRAPLMPGATDGHRHSGWRHASPVLLVAALFAWAVGQGFRF